MLMTLESWGQVMKLKYVILCEKDIFIKVGSYHIPPQQREKEDKKIYNSTILEPISA